MKDESSRFTCILIVLEFEDLILPRPAVQVREALLHFPDADQDPCLMTPRHLPTATATMTSLILQVYKPSKTTPKKILYSLP